MPEYTVDEELALQVESLAKRKPFESLTFNEALRRILNEIYPIQEKAKNKEVGLLNIELPPYGSKKAPSPKPSEWLQKIPELKNKINSNSWRAVCDYLKIETAGDSARRKLRKWVEINRPDWPEVPDV